MRRKALVLAVAFLVVVPVASAAESVFIHLTANFKEDDGPVCVAFNAAWRALLNDDTVEIFFDQEATYGIKQWEPGKTDLGLYPLPERILDLMVEAFAVTLTPGQLPGVPAASSRTGSARHRERLLERAD